MIFRDTDSALDFLLGKVKGPLRLGTPLGLGKPNVLLNRLYERMKADPSRGLEIYTALSLDFTDPRGLLAERFGRPFLDRHFGPEYPRLAYLADLHLGTMPAHVKVHEFYMQAGQLQHSASAQQSYISLNYTHVTPTLLDRGLNCLVQLVAREPGGRLSLSSNPDLTLDLHDLAIKRGRPLVKIAVVHESMPFLGGDAEVPEDYFDAVVMGQEHQHELFALPRSPLDPVSHLIGLHASQLVADGGTLQIGIGSLAEALTHFLVHRQRHNEDYRRLTGLANAGRPANSFFSAALFDGGLYGTSEMVMDSFMHLRQAGILKRMVSDKTTGAEHFLHGGFFLGSKVFYDWLRNLPPVERRSIGMTRISKVNDLYDADETSLRRQRRKARFFNSCMKTTLLGDAISETLSEGTVVSGVGGQYNFVAMSHELPDALSVLMMKSTRHENGKRLSNVVFEGGHLTIPRHLRDAVVTEYGVAFLRGLSDSECIKAMLSVADSEFQDALADQAKRAGKLEKDYRLPDFARQNTPARIASLIESGGSAFPQYPFGSDFTPVEETLVKALEHLKKSTAPHLAALALKGFSTAPTPYSAELIRMELETPGSIPERLNRYLLLGALAR
ncbi:MAG: acetyl-CoA hydrolase/transferase C-terminal domain-containing protein [Bdellovibrionota bacterium]